MGAPRPDVSREALRFHYLIVQLEAEGLSQREMAAQIGCHQSLISKWRRPEANGTRTGIGTEIVRGCKDGLGIDPDYFYDEYEGSRDYHRYLMSRASERSVKKRADEETKLSTLNRQLSDARRLLEELSSGAEQVRRRKARDKS